MATNNWQDYGATAVEIDDGSDDEQYTINYNTGVTHMVSGNLDDAKAEADAAASYTQQSITIENEEGEEIARRPWCSTLDGIDECEDPIRFGNYGYYGDWYEV